MRLSYEAIENEMARQRLTVVELGARMERHHQTASALLASVRRGRELTPRAAGLIAAGLGVDVTAIREPAGARNGTADRADLHR